MTFKFQNDASSNISCIPLFAPEWHLQSSDPTKIPAISFNTVYSAAPQFTTSLACQFKYAANLESNLQVTSASRSVFSTFDVLMRQSLCPQKSTLQEQISPQNLRKIFWCVYERPLGSSQFQRTSTINDVNHTLNWFIVRSPSCGRKTSNQRVPSIFASYKRHFLITNTFQVFTAVSYSRFVLLFSNEVSLLFTRQV